MSAEIYNTHRWRQLVKLLVRPGALCEIEECAAPSREIIFGLRHRHPLGPSLDHIIELQYGGAPYDPHNLRPAHLGCNVRKSNRLRKEHRAGLLRLVARAGRAKAAAAPSRAKRTASALDH
ncbi:HNH endonuclease [Microbacterium sp. Mu-80]|uniref:HNH endonuclease n=1 Tax=Microbacterium bandirmense TaxID=3122050 RepID=A0ABU8L9L7_9MICO